MMTRCITAQVPPDLWKKLDKLCAEFPAVSKSALLKAALSIAAETPKENFQRHLGRF